MWIYCWLERGSSFDFSHFRALRFLFEDVCLVTQSCLTLCDPMNYNLLCSSVQARILEWVAMPSSRGSSQPRDGTQISHIAGRFLTSWVTREASWRWSSLTLQGLPQYKNNSQSWLPSGSARPWARVRSWAIAFHPPNNSAEAGLLQFSFCWSENWGMKAEVLGALGHLLWPGGWILWRLLLSQFCSGQSLSRVWICDPMDSSMPGLSVHQQLPELAQTHVHRVSDAVQTSHLLLSPTPTAFNLFQP